MQMRLTSLFAFLIPVTVSATDPEVAHDLGISADVPIVKVAPRRPGQIAMQLPSLTYALTLTAECGENRQPTSVSVTVADSKVWFSADKLQETRSLEFALQVPSNQIAPLRIENFCMKTDADVANQERLTISAVMSAQGSLRCGTDSAESIRYVTMPLDVMLECNVPEQTIE